MKLEKQRLIKQIIDSGYYDIDPDKGIIYSLRRGQRRIKKANILPTGYRQHTIFNGKRGVNGIKLSVYEHHIIFIAAKGIYPEGLQIDHVNGNKADNRISNLRTCTPLENLTFDNHIYNERPPVNDFKTIRGDEITHIRRLMSRGCSQSSIAQALGLNRLAVRYVYNRIKEGKPLKYEYWNKYGDKVNNTKLS